MRAGPVDHVQPFKGQSRRPHGEGVPPHPAVIADHFPRDALRLALVRAGSQIQPHRQAAAPVLGFPCRIRAHGRVGGFIELRMRGERRADRVHRLICRREGVIFFGAGHQYVIVGDERHRHAGAARADAPRTAHVHNLAAACGQQVVDHIGGGHVHPHFQPGAIPRLRATRDRHLLVADVHRGGPFGHRQIGGGGGAAPDVVGVNRIAAQDVVNHHHRVFGGLPRRLVVPPMRAAAPGGAVLARVIHRQTGQDEPAFRVAGKHLAVIVKGQDGITQPRAHHVGAPRRVRVGAILGAQHRVGGGLGAVIVLDPTPVCILAAQLVAIVGMDGGGDRHGLAIDHQRVKRLARHIRQDDDVIHVSEGFFVWLGMDKRFNRCRAARGEFAQHKANRVGAAGLRAGDLHARIARLGLQSRRQRRKRHRHQQPPDNRCEKPARSTRRSTTKPNGGKG